MVRDNSHCISTDLVSLKNIDFNHDQYRSAGVNLG